jgi:transposase
VQSALQLDALSGHLFVFFNRRGDVATVLFWDRTGFVLWRKRLERGCFHLRPDASSWCTPSDV